MPGDEPSTLYLIDGHAQFFRAYHAIRTGMTSPVTHEPTHLTYGFMGMLLALLRDHRPDYLAVVIDAVGDRETFRSAIDPEYKANRPAPPDDFRPQVDRCLELLSAMQVPVVAVPGAEADDVIASLIRRLRAGHPALRIRIVSRDKDLSQLLGPNVELYDPYKNELVSAADIFKTEGVRPEHVVDILALMGDAIDNIPGAEGIGPKTAAKLILEHGSLDGVVAHLDEIKGKRRESIEAAKGRFATNRALVALKDDLDVELDLSSARVDLGRPPAEPLLAMFRRLGFNTHAETLRAIAGGAASRRSAPGATAAPRAAGRDDAEGTLFADLAGRSPGAAAVADAPAPAAVERVTDAGDLAARVRELRRAGECAIELLVEPGAPAMRAEIIGIALAADPGRAAYVPLRGTGGEPLVAEAAALDAIAPLLEDERVAKIGHDLKVAMVLLGRRGRTLRGPLFDTMIASYVVDATRSSHAIDVLALALLGRTLAPPGALAARGTRRLTLAELAVETVAPFAAERVEVALRLREVLRSAIEEMGLGALFADVEMPLVEVLAALERNGIRVDRAELERQREKLARRIDELGRRIAASAPHPFNPDSPKQLAAALFNRAHDEPPGLGLKVVKRGKTGPSTDQEVLEKLAADPEVASEVPALILEYRQLQKLVSTYLVALAEEIDPATGRVHASFNQTGAATGRLSSSDPNLQNIPIRTEVGREIRRAFVAEPGHLLIAADYSQIELRLLAHLARDPALIEAFRSGLDIHVAVAAQVFGVAPAEVTPAQRTSAKMVNFGIVYGITPWGLARRLGPGFTVEAAGRIIADYKARFARIGAFLADCVAQAEERGYVETILKRRRLIPQIRARHPQQRAYGERMAINTVVQGSAADLIKLAMIDLHRRLPEAHPGVRMLLQIHDELVFEAPQEIAEAAQRFIVKRMEGAMTLEVPLVVDSARSACWIDAK